MGQVSEVFANVALLKTLKGTISIGHNRYGTTGESALKNVQPLFSELNIGGVAIAHNGNLTNTHKLKDKTNSIWILFFSQHQIQKLFFTYYQQHTESFRKVKYALNSINGAYSFINDK